MNKLFFSLLISALGLFMAFVLLNFSPAFSGGVFNPGFFVSDERIKTAFLDRTISLDDIPAGFYAWQAGTPAETLLKGNSQIMDETSSEAVYRNFKFKSPGGAWIKFLVTADSAIVFTSSGLISSGSSSNLDVLETISNKIKTTINESKKVKISAGADPSSDNIAAAIYNAVKDKMSVGAAKKFTDEMSGQPPSDPSKMALVEKSVVREIHIAGKKRGIYFETYLPGSFDRVRAAFVIKNSGHIARIFILSEKKTQFTGGGVRDDNFLGYFNGLLIGDVMTDNPNIFKESGAERVHFTNKYRLIELMSDVFPLIKNYIHGAGSEKL